MNRKLISIFLIAFIFQSCDPGYDAIIINESEKLIEIIFEYDEKTVRRNIERNISFMPEVVYNNENTRTTFKIDTTNFIVTSIVSPKDTLFVENGIGTHPNFTNIKKIRIYATDTIHLNTIEKMTEAFTEKEKNRYELKIK